MNKKKVLIVGGGFAGMNCASKLIKDPHIHVTLIDKNNYHNFTPLLYQVATSALSVNDVATSFRRYFQGRANMDIKMAHAISLDPKKGVVSTAEGEVYQADFIVLAAGSVVNFFNTRGAEQYSFPLYNLIHAEKLRSRIIAVFEDADRNPNLIDQGALNFVIVGAGPTGTEVAGAISDMLNTALPKEFSDLALKKASVYIVDGNHVVLHAFSNESQAYAAKVLMSRGVRLNLGLLVKEVTEEYVLLSNGDKILTKTIIWAGGLKAASLADQCSLPQGHGGRITTNPELTVEGFPTIYALGDFADILASDGQSLPQLGSVAKQSGEWAAANILNQIAGKPTRPFKYDDKGIMAMIGRNAAIAEIGTKRRELKGFIAYLAWLGVHASLLSTLGQKAGSIIQWIWNYFSCVPSLQILDREDSARINWNDQVKVKEKS